MASNTPNLDLLKKNPLTDGNDTFNIQTMLNDNWDKLDGAVGDLGAVMPALGLPSTASVAEGLSKLAPGLNIEIGSYVGTDSWGASAPNRLSFNFAPKFVIVSSMTHWNATGCIFMANPNTVENVAGWQGTITVFWSDKSVGWYANPENGSEMAYQQNSSGTNYQYVAFG